MHGGTPGMSVRLQLAAAFGVLLVMASAVIGIGILSLRDLESVNSEVAGHAVPYLTGLSDAAVAAKAAANDERGFLLTGNTAYVTECQGRRTAENTGLAGARAGATTAAERDAVDEVSAGLDAFNRSLDDEFGLFATDRAGALKVSTGRNRDLRKAYEKNFDAAIALAKGQVADASKSADQQAGRARAILLALLGVMVVVGIAACVLLGRAVIRPLARGIDVLEAAARGDLTGRIDPRGAREFRRMAHATNEMLTATSGAVATIAGSADTVNSTAARLAGASRDIAIATDGAAREAEQLSAAASQTSTSMQAVASAAQAVHAAEAAGGTVSRLDTSSTEIGNVVKAITAIAEQTNLLALNATIEAARAGDAGKGFSVVASEVKDLAQETARATEDIVRRVDTIQVDIRQAIDAIARITTVIGQINDHQSTIVSTVEEQSATTQEMTRSISEAAGGITSIAGNISSVAGIVQATTDDTDQARAAAAALAEMGDELRRLVGRFTYGPGPG